MSIYILCNLYRIFIPSPSDMIVYMFGIFVSLVNVLIQTIVGLSDERAATISRYIRGIQIYCIVFSDNMIISAAFVVVLRLF